MIIVTLKVSGWKRATTNGYQHTKACVGQIVITDGDQSYVDWFDDSKGRELLIDKLGALTIKANGRYHMTCRFDVLEYVDMTEGEGFA